MTLTHGDVGEAVVALPDGSVDAVLHDPPRFGIAGELYSQTFYGHLARVLRRKGRLFHYTGSPNQVSSGRDVPQEVTNRLRKAGFSVEKKGDGLLADEAIVCAELFSPPPRFAPPCSLRNAGSGQPSRAFDLKIYDSMIFGKVDTNFAFML